MQQNNQTGFTIIELMGVLLTFSVIILGSYKIANYLSEKNKIIANADKVKVIAHSVADFVIHNYRTIDTNMIDGESVLNQAELNSVLPDFIQSNTDIQVCLYLVHDTQDSLISYLVLSSDNIPNPSAIANIIGNNGYTVQLDNNNYKLIGINKNHQILTNATINLLNSKCGFRKSVINSLFINLNHYNEFINPSKGAIDSKLTSKDNTPAVKSHGTQLIAKSSIILDNVVKEAYTYETKHCNTSSLPANDPAVLCSQNLGTNIGIYSGTASWVSSTLSADQQSCIGVAKARFYRIDIGYTCNGVVLPDAHNYCNVTSNWVSKNLYGYQVANSPKYLIQGTAIWSPNPPELKGNICVSQAYARYQYPYCEFGIYDNRCSYIYNSRMHCPADAFDCPTGKNSSDVSATIDSYIAVLGNYDLTSAKCYTDYSCRNFKNQLKAVKVKFPIQPRYIQDASYTACNTITVPAQTVSTQVDLGYFNCSTTKNYNSDTQIHGVPEEHQYRALDLGASNQIGNSRVQIKTAASSGVASNLTELSILRSGLNAGLIVPENTDIAVGTVCTVNDLGRIVKQNLGTASLSGGQLKCMYNPTLCKGNGYCYLSVKDTSYTIKFNTPRSDYSCPNGTFVSNDQPSDAIIAGFVCPVISGYTATKQAYIRYLNPYSSVYDNSQIYQTLQTACNYKNNNNGQNIVVAVNALSKITCSTLNKTYEVNNYQQ